MEIVKLGISTQRSSSQQNLVPDHPHQQNPDEVETVICRIPIYVFHQIKYAIEHDKIGDARDGPVKGSWSQEEDNLLAKLVQENGAKRWSELAENIKGRNGKQCRERYLNHLDPCIKKEPFSEEEDQLIIHYHRTFGNQWSKIARDLQGRTPNAVKNRWNCTLRRKLREGRKVQKRRRMMSPSRIIQIPQMKGGGQGTPPNPIMSLPPNTTPFQQGCPPKVSLPTSLMIAPNLSSTSSAPFHQQVTPQQFQQQQQQQQINAAVGPNAPPGNCGDREVVYHEIFPPPQFTSPPQYHKLFEQSTSPSNNNNNNNKMGGQQQGQVVHPQQQQQQQQQQQPPSEDEEDEEREQQIRYYQEQMKYVDFVRSYHPRLHQEQNHQFHQRSHQQEQQLLQKPRNMPPQPATAHLMRDEDDDDNDNEPHAQSQQPQSGEGKGGKNKNNVDRNNGNKGENGDVNMEGFPFDPRMIVSRIRNEQTSDGKLIRRFEDEDDEEEDVDMDDVHMNSRMRRRRRRKSPRRVQQQQNLPPFHENSNQFSCRTVTTE